MLVCHRRRVAVGTHLNPLIWHLIIFELVFNPKGVSNVDWDSIGNSRVLRLFCGFTTIIQAIISLVIWFGINDIGIDRCASCI
jgi:hypothetical protein